MHVAMPDGTDVWLSPGTTLSYDDTFRIDGRNVELDGEAYFDVTHDAGQPFVVTAPAFRVHVLGTVFNVRSFSGEPVAEATLAEGAVALQHAGGRNLICLHPGQQAVYDAEAELLEVDEVPVGDLLLIRYGVVTLDNATLPEIVARIARTYGGLSFRNNSAESINSNPTPNPLSLWNKSLLLSFSPNPPFGPALKQTSSFILI